MAFDLQVCDRQWPAVRRDAVLLDTNVLVAFFGSDEGEEKLWARLAIEDALRETPIIVPVAVLVEAWGMLVGHLRNFQAGVTMLNWLLAPNNMVLLVPDDTSWASTGRNIAEKYRVDIVDAILVAFAKEVFERHGVKLRVLTYDARSFSALTPLGGFVFTSPSDLT